MRHDCCDDFKGWQLWSFFGRHVALSYDVRFVEELMIEKEDSSSMTKCGGIFKREEDVTLR